MLRARFGKKDDEEECDKKDEDGEKKTKHSIDGILGDKGRPCGGGQAALRVQAFNTAGAAAALNAASAAICLQIGPKLGVLSPGVFPPVSRPPWSRCIIYDAERRGGGAVMRRGQLRRVPVSSLDS